MVSPRTVRRAGLVKSSDAGQGGPCKARHPITRECCLLTQGHARVGHGNHVATRLEGDAKVPVYWPAK